MHLDIMTLDGSYKLVAISTWKVNEYKLGPLICPLLPISVFYSSCRKPAQLYNALNYEMF